MTTPIYPSITDGSTMQRLAQKTERLTGQVIGAKEQELKTMIRLLLAGMDSGHLDAAVLQKAREIGR